MKVSRNFAIAVQYILDEWVPPKLRDSYWFMRLPMKMLFKDHADDFMYFKNEAFKMSESEFGDVYRRVASVSELQGETDLNQACTEAILKSLVGSTVLEVGAGRGYLANKMSKTGIEVTAVDIVVSEDISKKYPDIKFVESNIEDLPFEDNSFDTVVTTHTLEHVQDLQRAIAELRRITRRRLIIVVPRQRPYKYTFSLHINFFPYTWSLIGQFGNRPNIFIKRLGDWFYIEDVTTDR